MNRAAEVTLDFSLTGTDDGQPVAIDSLYFSVLDMDEGKRMKLRESVTVAGYASSYLTEDTEIKTTTLANGVGRWASTIAMRNARKQNTRAVSWAIAQKILSMALQTEIVKTNLEPKWLRGAGL